jgi:hypothetical protein
MVAFSKSEGESVAARRGRATRTLIPIAPVAAQIARGVAGHLSLRSQSSNFARAPLTAAAVFHRHCFALNRVRVTL